MIDIGFIAGPEADRAGSGAARRVVGLPAERPTGAALRQCPKCGSAGLIRQEGCDSCVNCGYSKCG